MGVQDGREPMHGRQSMRWVLGVLEMNSAEMEYNMSSNLTLSECNKAYFELIQKGLLIESIQRTAGEEE
tara:strand:- start:210 stop:416 length:207 start_codon:yes stop_codon:yes gene_type:complete